MRKTVAREASGAFATLELERLLRAAPDQVFKAYTDPEALKRWWCPPECEPSLFRVDPHVGGEFALVMTRRDDESVLGAYGTFLEIDAPRRLVYTLRWEGRFPDLPETRVSIDFVEVDAGTLVRLTQEGFRNLTENEAHRSTWIEACDRAEQVLSGQEKGDHDAPGR